MKIDFIDIPSKVHFLLQTYNPVIFLWGEGATGKTFFFKALDQAVNDIKRNIRRPPNETLDPNIFVILDDNNKEFRMEHLFSNKVQDTIVCIDCFSTLHEEFPGLIDYISNDETNSYVIAGRGIFPGLEMTNMNTHVADFNKAEHKITFKPLFDGGKVCTIW